MLWKIYFWIVVFIETLSLITGNVSDLINEMLVIVVIVGIFGLAWQKSLGPRLFWQILSFIFIISQSVTFFRYYTLGGTERIAALTGGALIAPAVIGIFMYAFSYLPSIQKFKEINKSYSPPQT